MSNIVNWNGHQFHSHQHSAAWHEVGGIYIFAKQVVAGNWHALYIGQAKSFADRLTNHERWPDAVRHGASHVHAMVVAGQSDRDAIEERLIRMFQPPLNTHHR